MHCVEMLLYAKSMLGRAKPSSDFVLLGAN
jgi:hypothetical protein